MATKENEGLISADGESVTDVQHTIPHNDNLAMANWNFVEPQLIDDNEKWDIPFAFGRSWVDTTEFAPVQTHYTTNQGDKKVARNLYDIIEIPIREQEVNYKFYAKSLKRIIDKGRTLEFDQFKFDSKIDFYNMIIYIPEIVKSGLGRLTLPNTTVPILGKVITDLLAKNKAWIILEANSRAPVTNLVLESLERAVLEVKLTPRIKKRLNFMGLYDKQLRNDFKPDAPNQLENKRYQISNNGCKELLKTMASAASSKVLQGCVVLRHNQADGKVLKENILHELSRILKIPALKMDFIAEPGKRTCYQIKLNFLDPNYVATGYVAGMQKVYNFYRKEPELYSMILETADDYFYRNDEDFKGNFTFFLQFYPGNIRELIYPYKVIRGSFKRYTTPNF